VAVLLGDNIIEQNVKEEVEAFVANPTGAKIFLTKVDHPEWYGIAALEGDRVTSIVEKPKPGEEPSKLAVIGLYLYDGNVFDIVKTLKPSARGELEVTDVNNAYLEKGQLSHAVLQGWWADAGESFEMYLKAQTLARDKALREK
jgi:glucose-1-phosphate thymidylyltransferase